MNIQNTHIHICIWITNIQVCTHRPYTLTSVHEPYILISLHRLYTLISAYRPGTLMFAHISQYSHVQYRSHMFINAHPDYIHSYLHTQITRVCVFLHRCTQSCSSPKDMYICPTLFLVGTSWSWGSSLTPPGVVPQATNICWGLLFANWATQPWNFFFLLLQASDHKSQKLVIFLWPFSYACCLIWHFRWKLNPHNQCLSWLVEPGSKRAVTLTWCLS